MIGWLLSVALAGPQAESETVIQLRHDLFGETISPVYQYLRLSSDDGPVGVDGYLGFEPGPDGGAEGVRVYALNASGDSSVGEWRLGTQTVLLPMRPQTLDGGSLTLPLGPGRGEIHAIAGYARHHDVDDLLDGIGLGRLEWRANGQGWAARLGGQAEAFGDGGPVSRQDAELRLGDPDAGEIAGLAAIAEPSGGIEWARAEARTWFGSRVELMGWAEHRAVLAETLLSDDILVGIAGSPVEDTGGRIRMVGPRRGSVAFSLGLGRYTPFLEPVITHHAEVEWVPSGKVLPPVAWRFREGPGGAYHAFSTAPRLSLGDRFALGPRLAVIPYRKLADVWRLAGTAGTDLSGELGPHARLALGGDVASDAVWKLDLRAHAALTLVWP